MIFTGLQLKYAVVENIANADLIARKFPQTGRRALRNRDRYWDER
jgi:hypothetical protein